MTEYYMVIGGNRVGPMSKEDMMSRGLRPETLIWCAGMPEWRPASTVPEIAALFGAPEESAFGTYAEVVPPTSPSGQSSGRQYFAMLGSTRIGPMSAAMLARSGVTPQTPVWCNGMADWAPASTQPEVMEAINAARMGGMAVPAPAPAHYNWLTWAIIGTVAGGLFSCIGLIFGILGIVNANKANTAYMQGDDLNGDRFNSTARIMTIISLVLAGVGVLGTAAVLGGAFQFM